MKRRVLYLLAGAGAALVMGWFGWRQFEYSQESYEGRHTRDWAWVLLASPNQAEREEAESALRHIGPHAVPVLQRMLLERDKFYEKPLIQAARALPLEQRQAFVRSLHPGQAMGSRLAAITALGVLGAHATVALPELERNLRDPVGLMRWESAQALVRMGEPGWRVLATAAQDTNAAVRQAVFFILGSASTNAVEVVGPVVLAGLLDTDAAVLSTAGYTAQKLGLDPLPTLNRALNSEIPETQLAALRGLAICNSSTRAISSNVVWLAGNATGELRRQALECLGDLHVTSTNAARIAVQSLEANDPALRLTAIRTVGRINWRTADAIPRLQEFAHAADVRERALALQALGEFGARASNALQNITERLNDPEVSVREAATNTLNRIRSALNPP